MEEDPKQGSSEDLQVQVNAELDSPDQPKHTSFLLLCYGKILHDLFNAAQGRGLFL